MNAAVIVAAGKGVRMRSQMRKQYLSMRGLPIVGYTLRIFDACQRIDEIFLGLAEKLIHIFQWANGVVPFWPLGVIL